MSVKAKITLIVWGIIAFLWGWVIFVMSLIWNWNQTTDIIASQVNSGNWIMNGKKDFDWWRTDRNWFKSHSELVSKSPAPETSSGWQSPTNSQNSNNSTNPIDNPANPMKSPTYPNTKWETFNILAPKSLLSPIAWRFFQINFKKNSWWIVKYNFYENEKKYNKDLIYKLVTKDNSFDFAIIPAYWFNQIEKINDVSFKIPKLSFNISSLFDYNFNSFLSWNNIKALPFAIDPIIWFWTYKKNISTNQTFETWKNLIISNPNRLNKEWKIQNMPVFLWYDKKYINYVKNSRYSYFPVFDFILNYYVFKKSDEAEKLIKDFWFGLTYKTFDFHLFQYLSIKYRKYDFCKNYEKFCLLFSDKSNLVYGFTSNYNYFHKNWLNIYKKFRFNVNKIKYTTLPLANFQAEYPARWWIIIINPNSKNLKNLWKFIQTYIQLWQNNLLPFYKNMISPFLKTQTINKKFAFLQNYLWRFMILKNMWINYPQTLTNKEMNFLLWNISTNTLNK